VFYLVNRREDLRGKRIVIAGGGDSAVDWAISLADLAARVMVVHRRGKFRAAPASEAKLKDLAAQGAVDLVVPYQLHGLEGSGGRLEAVTVATLDGQVRRLPADVLLPFFGLASDLGPIAQWGLAMDGPTLTVDPVSLATNLPGVFAIGDMAAYAGKLKLILQGFSEAAMAAQAAFAVAHPGQALHFEHSTTTGVPGIG
jgi:thioredoxin reductase (NADPH)